MLATSWGEKRVCFFCQCRFYDMGKDPAPCPDCGKNFDYTALFKGRRKRFTESRSSALDAFSSLENHSDHEEEKKNDDSDLFEDDATEDDEDHTESSDDSDED